MTVHGAGKTVLRITGKRARDHPADVHIMQNRRHVPAQAQEPLQPEMLFMRRNLKHAVSRRVTDRPAGLDMLVAQLVNDRGARGMFVAQYAVNASRLRNKMRQRCREARHCIFKVMPVPGHRHAGKFPVTRRGVFAF